MRPREDSFHDPRLCIAVLDTAAAGWCKAVVVLDTTTKVQVVRRVSVLRAPRTLLTYRLG